MNVRRSLRFISLLLGLLLPACTGGAPEAPVPVGAGGAAGGGGRVAAGDSVGTTAGDSARLNIHILRVTARSGGGDAILVADSTIVPARHILIDAGDDSRTAAQLVALGVPALDLVVLTHAHHDHYGGLNAILDTIPVRAFAFNGQVRTAVTYRRLLERIEREVPVIIVVDTLRRVRLGPADGEDGGGPGDGSAADSAAGGVDVGGSATVLTLLPPRPEDLARDTDDGRRLNNGSLGVRLDRGGFSFLTTGDAQLEANRRFAADFDSLVAVTILKAGHHGANNATQEFWLEAADPEVVVISANGTTHPHAEALALIAARGIPIYCTPQHGRITLRVDRAGGYTILTTEPAERRCEPGSER